MTAHCSVLAWKIPWTEAPGGLVCGVADGQTRLSKQHVHVHYRINNETKMGIMKLRKNFKANGFTSR